MAATVERPAGIRPAYERVPEREPSSTAQPVRFALELSSEQLAWIGLVALAFVLRFWDLGTRAMHHDESMHAFYSWKLFSGDGYQYNPMLHGPFQFHATALMDFLFGVSDGTARLTAVLCGTGLVVGAWFLRPWLGRLGALFAGILLAISPSFLYFSRFTREDIYVTFFTLLMVAGLFGWLHARKAGYLYLLFTATALAFATKESTFITLFIFGSFLILVLLREYLERRSLLPAQAGPNEPGTLGVTRALQSIDRRTWVIATLCFAVVTVLLYTTFLTNRRGLLDAFTSSLGYWLGQQDVARGNQPGYYYGLMLPAYEQIPALFGLIGMGYYVYRWWSLVVAAVVVIAGQLLAIFGSSNSQVVLPILAVTALILGIGAVVLGLARGRLMATFLTYWAMMAFVIYSWAGEKMPWLILQMALPLLLLAALFLSDFLRQRPWNEVRWAVAGVCVLLLGYGLHVAWPLNYIRGDVPREPLIYTQTSPQVKTAVSQIARLSDQLSGGTDLKITIDNLSTWPFAWYLRDYKNLTYVQGLSQAPETPVVITAVEQDAQSKPLLSNYVGNRYHLRTWFNEDYRDLTFPKVVQSVTDPVLRKSLWNWLTLRETTSMGGYDFNLWIRKDLAGETVSNFTFVQQPAIAAPAAVLGPDPFADKTVKVASQRVFGSQGNGDGQLSAPRGLASATDGSMYVADQANHRIQKFDASGKFLLKWGGKGSGDGQFESPSGVAVDSRGNVWVTDLWNHRVQQFDANGKFVSKFGGYANATGRNSPGLFFGPRAIGIGPDGAVYVTDTGNKRVQKFGADGKFVTAWGQGGSAPGQLEEPIGLAVDRQGFVYVADTWNRRVQKFDGDGKFISQIAVGSWPSAQATNGEPNLAVGPDGTIVATDPLRSRILTFSPDGQLLSAWGGPGNDGSSLSSPTGVALTSAGNVLVSDSANNRIVIYPATR